MKIESIREWLKTHLEFHREKINIVIFIGIIISLVGTLIGSSDTVDCLRFLHRAFVPEVYRIDEGMRELTFFPPNGKHAALSRNEAGFKEILEIIRKNDRGVPEGVVQMTNRKEHPINFYWAEKGDQNAILLDLVEGADEQNEVYPVNYTSIVLPWISQERTRILASRGFIWIFVGILLDLIGCFFGIRFKQYQDQSQVIKSETSKLRDRMRFFIALLIPIVYLNLPDVIKGMASLPRGWPSLDAGPRLLFSGYLVLLVIIFVLLPEKCVKRWFRFCGMQDSDAEKDWKNRWEKVCYGFIYGSLGMFVISLCLYKPERLPLFWFPDDVLMQYAGVGGRLMWCFGWGITGLSIASISDARRKPGDVKSPFPSYVYFYPSFVIVNSLVIFGLLHLLTAKGEIYYSLASFFSLNLGFWVDSINFNRLFDGMLTGVGKMLNQDRR